MMKTGFCDKVISKVSIVTVALLAAASFGLIMTGCDDVSPEDKVDRIARTIKISTSSAVSIGLVAVPDVDEADEIAEQAIEVLENSVLPILEGDEAGFVDAIDRLRDLSVFADNPKLEKFRAILEKVLPLLEANIPDDLADKAVDQVPADVRAYMTAFFEGVYNGAKSYLGDGDELRGGSEYRALRERLAK